MADIKNFFDCIPLWWKDQKYEVYFTPMGIYCMLCMTYGFMNAALEAPKHTNELAMFVTNSLAYIDDIHIKHVMEEGTKGIHKVDMNFPSPPLANGRSRLNRA